MPSCAGLPGEIEERRLDLLDRASLHAVDSFFNVMRQRVSYLHRTGMSRSSNEHYNAFQPYQPSQLQKIVDISRIYFNWCEARPFRVSRKFRSTDPQPHDPMHDKLDNLYEEHVRRTRREEYSTPAMRMHLAKVPVAKPFSTLIGVQSWPPHRLRGRLPVAACVCV